jgi:cystathionine gamma-synthase
MTTPDRSRPATWLAKAGFRHDSATGGVAPSIPMSTTFVRDADYDLPDGRLYLRDDNPLFEQAESILAQLEGAAAAAVFASGLAAMAAVVSTLGRNDRVVLAQQCYFGVRNWLLREADRVGFDLELFDVNAADGLERALDGKPTSLVWVESPANPTWEVVDIAAAATAAHGAGAKLVVDATVTTPLICRPIELGADYVMHSATKFLNGHSDVLAGALATAADDEHWQRICEVRYHAGAVLGPLEAWLLIRGMRTLHVRLGRSCQNAQAIAQHFEGHPAIRGVLYPGLESDPGHALATRQWNTDVGYTGMLSLRVNGGAEVARRVATRTKIFLPATSLGGVESLIEHRATVEEGKSDVPEDLIRLSVGIEDSSDLIADLEVALGATN